MGELNREEVEAKIETAEMRMTSSVARIEERFAAFAALMEERDKETRAIVARIDTEVQPIKAENRDTRKIVVITGITGVLTVIFGVAAINLALLTHFQGGIEAGTRMAGEHEAIRKDIRDLAVSVAEIKQRLPRGAGKEIRFNKWC